jgi:hypothetical protein
MIQLNLAYKKLASHPHQSSITSVTLQEIIVYSMSLEFDLTELSAHLKAVVLAWG